MGEEKEYWSVEIRRFVLTASVVRLGMGTPARAGRASSSPFGVCPWMCSHSSKHTEAGDDQLSLR